MNQRHIANSIRKSLRETIDELNALPTGGDVEDIAIAFENFAAKMENLAIRIDREEDEAEGKS